MIINPSILTSGSSETIFLMAFCHFFGEMTAGRQTAVIMIASAISRMDGVMNMGRGLKCAFDC